MRRNTRDVGQLLLSKSGGCVSKFRFAEYVAIRAIFAYLWLEATIITKNTTRANFIKMHGREKEKIKFTLKNAPSRISLTFDLWT